MSIFNWNDLREQNDKKTLQVALYLDDQLVEDMAWIMSETGITNRSELIRKLMRAGVVKARKEIETHLSEGSRSGIAQESSFDPNTLRVSKSV